MIRDMSLLSMMEARLPPGFRFHPRDEELVCDYLERRISGCSSNGSNLGCPMMIDVDLNQCEPWDLPEMASLGGKVWFFYSLRDRKYATGQRMNRATQSGYWKATGKDRPVMRKGVLVGMRKTLVFYQGRAPKGKKTNWVMHEFRIETLSAGDSLNFSTKEDWVLCRVFFKGRSMVPNPLPPPEMTTLDPFSGYNCSSSSLPPLMDSYISLYHPHENNHHEAEMSLQSYEQVSCFSNPLASGSSTAITHRPADPPLHPAGNFFGQLPSDLTPQLMNPLVYDCDRKMIQAVLSHLTKVEGAGQKESSMTLEDGVIESYLSPEAGPQNIYVVDC